MGGDATASMAGKTCLVTGATSGIGAVTARKLAARGATVVVVGRSRERCEATAGRIKAETGATVDPIVADLSSRDEVRRLAGEFRERYPRLDVLVNNAGAMFSPRRESADGIETTWALNHLAYFLLTTLLLDTLKASAPARVVNVSSEAHRGVKGIDWDDVEGRRRYKPFRAYCQSKLANVLFSNELARRLEGTGVTSNALHPGFVSTGFFLSGKGRIFWVMKQAARFLALSPEEGAKTSVHLAASPEVEGVTGRYFEKCRPVEPSPAARDEAAAKRLWQLSAAMTGLTHLPQPPSPAPHPPH
jgi:NAD(P)-dependent dehydrogenase (short-subunit alcohol dehydrogenase family)